LAITAAVDLSILFGFENRGASTIGEMLLILAILFGGASLVTALAMCVVRFVAPLRFGRDIVLQAFAVTFFFLQFALVREAGVHLMKGEVREAKQYCNVVIAQIRKNGEGKYPQTLDDTKLPLSKPRLLKRRTFYKPSNDLREYVLSFSWDFECSWVYSSKYGRWHFRS
jgi:hypothetical protein